MLQTIKNALPRPIKKILVSIKQSTYNQWQKKLLFKRMQKKHTDFLKIIKEKA